MASKEQELAIKIGGKVSSSLNSSISSANSGISSLSSTAKTVAAAISAAFAAVKITQFITDAISEYSEFEAAMSNTSAIASATTEEYEALEAAARAAGKATTFTATEAAEALGYMALAGWDTETSVAALTPVLQLAEATSADLATTSDQVTDSMSALGIGVDDLSDYLDVIIATNNNANTTASDLMDAFIGCGGAAKAAGLDYEDTATALGILANNGIKGSEAGTALNAMLVRISTKQAAQDAFAELGVAVYDSAGNMRELQDILVDTSAALDGMSDSEKNSYLSAIAGTNYYSDFQYLLDGVTESADGTASAWDTLTAALDSSEGALEAMDATVTDTLSGAMSRFSSAISDLKISLVEDFGPYAKEIIDAVASAIPNITANLSNMIKSLPINEFMTGMGNMIGGVFDFLAMLTGGEGILDSFTIMLGEDFGTDLPQIVYNAIGVFSDFVDKLQDVAEFLKNQAVAAFEAVRAKIEDHEPQIQAVIDLANDLKNKLFEAFENAKPTIEWLAQTALPAIVDGLMDTLGWAADVLDKFVEWDGFIPTITTIGASIAAFKLIQVATNIAKVTKALTLLRVAKIKDKAETIYLNALYAKDAVVKAASTAATWAQTAAITAWNAICAVATTVTTALGAAFTFLTSPIGLVILAIAAVIAIGVLLYKNWDTIKEKAAQLGQWLSDKFTAIKEAVLGVLENLKEKFPFVFDFISNYIQNFKDTVAGIFAAVKQVFQGAIDFVTGVFTGNWSKALDGIKGIFSGVFNGLKSVVTGALNNVKNVASTYYGALNTLTGGKLDSIKEAFTSKLSSVKDTVSTAFSNVKETASSYISAAKETVGATLGSMKTAFEENGGGIKGAVSASMEGVKTFFSTGLANVDELTGGKLSEIKEKFADKFASIKETVGNILSGIKDKFTSIFDSIKDIVQGAIDKILNIFDFSWSLPKLSLPHISVEGGKAPYGIAGKGSLPSFSIEWYKEGGIKENPTAFGVNPSTNSLMVGGEAGAEAIVPLSELWSNMQTLLQNILGTDDATETGSAISNAISVLAEKLEAAIEGANELTAGALSKSLGSSSSSSGSMELAGTGMTITYAPVYNIEGSADKDTLVEAESISQSKFAELMAQWQKDNNRKSF